MTHDVFDRACQEYLSSHVSSAAQRLLMWSAILARAELDAAGQSGTSDDAAQCSADIVAANHHTASHDGDESQQIVAQITGGQWCRVFEQHQHAADTTTAHRGLAASQPAPVPALPDPVTKRVTAMMAALLFYNGLTALEGFSSFAEQAYAPDATLSFETLKLQGSALLHNVNASDLEHWFKHGLGGGAQPTVLGKCWIDVMQPAVASHEARVCKEYMLALAALFRRKDVAEILKLIKCAKSASDDSLSLDGFVDGLLNLLLSQSSEDDGSILRAAGEGGTKLMRSIWTIAFQQQSKEGRLLTLQHVEQAVATMSRATILLVPDHQSRLLSSLLLLAALNDVPLAEVASPSSAEQLSMYDYLCDLEVSDAPAPPSADAALAAAASELQLSRQHFSKTIAKLLENHGVQEADLQSLWLQLFGSADSVDQATWSRVLSSAGIHVKDESLIDGCTVSQAPRDRLHALFQLIPNTAAAALLCRAVQFECRSHPDALHSLLQDACSFHGLVTRDVLVKMLSRCFQKYSDGGTSSRGDSSTIQNVSSLADILWSVGSLASSPPSSSAAAASSGTPDSLVTVASEAPVLLPAITITAIIEAIRKYTGKFASDGDGNAADGAAASVAKSAAAPVLAQPSVHADVVHHVVHRTGKFVGDGDGAAADSAAADGAAASVAKSAAAPVLAQPSVHADVVHPVVHRTGKFVGDGDGNAADGAAADGAAADGAAADGAAADGAAASVAKSAAAPVLAQPSVHADVVHPAVHRTGKFVGDGDGAAADGTAASVAKSAAAPVLAQPSVHADVVHPVAAAHAPVVHDASNCFIQVQNSQQPEQFHQLQQHQNDPRQKQEQQHHQQPQQQHAIEQLATQFNILSQQLKVM
jgi:hypothetical protein